MHFLNNYGLFLVKLISVVVAILCIFAGLMAIALKGKTKTKGKLTVKLINDTYKEYSDTLLGALEDKKKIKALAKADKARHKAKDRKRLFLINFHGDIRASAVTALREEITALLLIATPKDEVLVCLESGGGMVNAYGLAASQLNRIRAAKIKLVISVDKVAASGGYMMACVANHVIAAPFAIIGSIGVIAQLPNFYHYLKNKHIDFEQITAGEFKRTLTIFGENTEKGREKMQEDIDDIHILFKNFVQQHRPELDINQVATGEHWFGEKAHELKLVDELRTSDDYLLAASKSSDIYQLQYQMKKTLPQRLASGSAALWQKLMYSGSHNTGQDYI